MRMKVFHGGEIYAWNNETTQNGNGNGCCGFITKSFHLGFRAIGEGVDVGDT